MPGKSFPLGSSLRENGANFSLFSKNATGVDLLLFDKSEDTKPARKISLSRHTNKTYHYWHVFVEGIKAGQLYAYSVHGPKDPENGHHFDSDLILLDPYAKAIAFPTIKKGKTTGKNKAAAKSVICDMSLYDWEGDLPLHRAPSQTIIYELHVAGFTKNPNSGVAAAKRGTYAGLIEKIPYLVELGITAVELLPVFQFDDSKNDKGIANYWGYSPISFFALHNGYSRSADPLEALDEFRDMVKALHRAGIEVILDVVYNHTAEGGTGGPTWSFRGIDNSVYYILEENKAWYANYSGCGNTLNANHPAVRRMIIDSLHFWVKDMHVDGFRFDLASILSRDHKGRVLENPPLLWDIESDPILAGTKLIAEAWDASGLYQVGSFIGDTWTEWNGKFRDDVRCFMKGDNGKIKAFAQRLLGSPDLYLHEIREAEQSVNFITCHDGFTLNDLVSYNQKHNEANGEDNRDGSNDNHSWNGGVEGPTDDQEIEAWRLRQIKNFFAITLLSLGAPMLSMGDEVRRTQHGNNNPYCQDNEISWFDWSTVSKNEGLIRFVKMLNSMRLSRESAQKIHAMSLRELLSRALITWHGVKLNEPDWSEHSHTIAFTVQSLSASTNLHFMINAWRNPLAFQLPETNGGKKFVWKKWIDTNLQSPFDITEWNKAPKVSDNVYELNAFSVVVLVSENI
jgi:glycogen operon protein